MFRVVLRHDKNYPLEIEVWREVSTMRLHPFEELSVSLNRQKCRNRIRRGSGLCG